ncbi:MAG: glucosaminidase domain-containing protein [Bacteroidota bacterium]
MHKTFILSLWFLFLHAVVLSGQTNHEAQQAYIEAYKDIAIEEMNQFKIPASIKLAQGILETNSGRSRLAVKANNHFGIKCHTGWNGPTIRKTDDAFKECFRKYDDPAFSYRDHSLFLTGRSRYARLFQLDIKDYKGWARGLRKAGYATNPRYARLLIDIIERHKLYKFDKLYSPEPVAYRKPLKAVAVPTYDDFEVVDRVKGRKIYENNGKELVVARDQDSYLAVARDLGVELYDLRYYNDLVSVNNLPSENFVYLEKKRWRSQDYKHHIVRKNETWHTIAQLYGIRLSWLHLYNIGKSALKPGDKIRLRIF